VVKLPKIEQKVLKMPKIAYFSRVLRRVVAKTLVFGA